MICSLRRNVSVTCGLETCRRQRMLRLVKATSEASRRQMRELRRSGSHVLEALALVSFLLAARAELHAGGNAALKKATGAFVVAPGGERGNIDGVDRAVEGGERVRLGEFEADVIATPGHTLGHIIYHFPAEKVAFVGDTIFALGCGRLFEGTPEQMWDSLKAIRALPKDTQLYCAHEYTQANARFALTVETDNDALKAYAGDVDRKRKKGEPTVPTTVGAELEANPFLRADKAPLKKAVGLPNAAPEMVFAEVRARKDRF